MSVSASGPNFGMSTPPPAILLPTPSSTLETAFENPFPSPEPVLPAILPADVPFSDPALLPLTSLDHSGNPSLVFGTVTNADTEYGFGSVSAQPQPQIYQGAESPPQAPVPAAATTAGLDSIPLHQLLASAHDTHLPTLRPSEGAGPRDNTFTSTRSSLPANHDEHYPPTISQSQIAESHPPEVEMDSTSCPRSPTSDHVSAGMLTARQQEPPFMTDGRGRVVWSHSGVKRGDSPLASRGQERVSVNPGDISSTDTS
ncbi:hypothetical protein BC834DRAFT_348885 [Gloeopeniophorella convolvens]|nr:hypothetical protein BC834DRAFT_348885 [Gloeopeniophorella convolvens]